MCDLRFHFFQLFVLISKKRKEEYTKNKYGPGQMLRAWRQYGLMKEWDAAYDVSRRPFEQDYNGFRTFWSVKQWNFLYNL